MRMTMTPETFEAKFNTKANSEQEAAFHAALQGALDERTASPVPSGLEQRLLARLAQAADLTPAPVSAPRQPFAFVEIGKAGRSASSFWTALGVHGAAIAAIAFVVAAQVQIVKPRHVLVMDTLATPPPPPPVVAVKADKAGGGGGQHDPTPAAQGRLPRFAPQQIMPPMQPPKLQPRLAVEPTVVMQDNLHMANNDMVNIGLPNSSLNGVSLGNGSGTGVGSGNGPGVGPGSGGGAGGGLFHVGGLVRKPELVYSPDPEFSEEARKAKFSGNVEVYLWVDEQGNPSHIRVTRGIGMGLDEKALEAVRQYKFKPATQNGKPVKVDLYIDVNFTIL